MPLSSDDRAVIARSRPAPNMDIAREVGDLLAHVLGDGRSVIDPGVAIWTSDAAEELRARVAVDPLEADDADQWAKLDTQLRGASREVVLLAAEVVLLREHVVRSITPQTRRSHVDRVLAHLGPETVLPDHVAAWLARPVGTAGARVGQRYFSRMWRHIVWVSTFVCHWNSLPEDERETARRSPWDLQRIMLTSGEDEAEIRNALQFLACPEVFELITAAEMKRRVRDGLADRFGGPSGEEPGDIDRDLLAIRLELAKTHDGPFNFWDPWVRSQWDASFANEDVPAASPAEPRERRYWLYSPGNQASQWESFLAEGIMAIDQSGLGDLADYSSRESIRRTLDPEGTRGSMRNVVLAAWQFHNEMAIGDVIYSKRGTSELVGRGEVTSSDRFEPSRDSFQNVRSVKWTHSGSWEHPGKAQVKTLTDVTPYRDYVERLESLFSDEDEAELITTVEPLPSYGKPHFLQEVYLSDERYDRLRSLLMRKKNLILAGPPGVGKTFVAKRLAHSIMGMKDPGRIQVVQFHQSYSYEDFMMGYRPTEQAGFILTEGPFYRFCEQARADDADKPYFFIIDEINRGNISKIFGELLMLIEADKRGHDLRLLYKNERFSVPPNVHIIGMMNTADRSLAVLDYALRRRFGFFEMRPGFQSEGFERWQKTMDSPALDRLIEVLVELNSVIAEDAALGRGFEIGHSFFAGPTIEEGVQEWLLSVVEDELVPLLDEYWFDEQARSSEWADKLRNAVR